MKKLGILNKNINECISSLGHTDRITVCDAGLPIPYEDRRIDISLAKGIPAIIDVINAVLAEIVVEEVILAEEIKEISPEMHRRILEVIGDIPVKYVRHSEFKEMSRSCKAIIRTGEFTPYSSIQLVCGCAF